MSIDKNLGHATAYGYAKSKGYTGTEEQFAIDLANAGTTLDELDEKISTFINTTVPNAVQSVTSEGTAQVANVQTAGQAQIENVNTAGATQVTAVQAKGEEVLDSIPADYTELSNDVTGLKSALDVQLEITSNNQINQSDFVGKTASQINDVPVYFFNKKTLAEIGASHTNFKVYLSIGGSTSLNGIVFYLVDADGNNLTGTLSVNRNNGVANYPNACGVRIHAYSSATSGAIDGFGFLFDNASYDEYAGEYVSSKVLLANTWKGKKWISYGDSITAGNTWQPYVVNALELAHINKGIGGSTVASNPDASVTPFCDAERVATLDADADIVTIMGGTNDYNGTNNGQGTPLGTLPTTATYDTTEFYGALCQTVRLIQAQCPNALIVIMSNINSRGTAGQAGNYPPHNQIGLCSADYAKASEEVANYLGCAFIDMAKCGINIYNRATYVSDTVHPNGAGGKLMSRMVIAYLSTHLPNE